MEIRNPYLSILRNFKTFAYLIESSTSPQRSGFFIYEKLRDITTEKRIKALNALYKMVAKYTGIGKDIFYETNEAKYNDYVIYDSPGEITPEIIV